MCFFGGGAKLSMTTATVKIAFSPYSQLHVQDIFSFSIKNWAFQSGLNGKHFHNIDVIKSCIDDDDQNILSSKMKTSVGISFGLYNVFTFDNTYMSHFAYSCKTKGENGISHLISEMA